MKAVQIREHGDLEALQFADLPEPSPGAGQLRIRIRAASLNHLDVWVRRGIPGVKYPLPIVPGCDGAGEVDAVGPGVSHFREGQKILLSPGLGCGVCESCVSGTENLCRHYGILGESYNGTCAEKIVVDARRAIPMPENLSFEEAAAIPLVFLTAWHMVVERARVKPGETVLIHAAGSGVSSAAVQIAKLFGATVIVTAGTQEKCEKGKKLGADHGVVYTEKDFFDEVKALTGKRGVDVAIDHVGKATMEKSIRLLVKGGRLVTCGTTSGPEISLDFRHVFFKSLSILGSTMGGQGELRELLRHVAAGRLKAVVDSVLPLSEVRKAHARLSDRAVFGKIVLKC